MYIMDRYLLRQFFKTFGICFLSLTGLYIVFDLFTNLEQFIRCGRKVGGVIPFIAHYYSYKTILFFDRTSGLLVLVSAMFTVSWIQRHNEMTALMSAGVSRIRVLAPIIVAVVVVGLLTAANRELVIPRYRDELSRHPQNPLGDQARPLEPRYDGQTDVLLGGKRTFSDQKRIEEPSFILPPDLRQYGNHLTAENAYYKLPEGNRPGGYLLDGVYEPKNLEGRPSLLQWKKLAATETSSARGHPSAPVRYGQPPSSRSLTLPSMYARKSGILTSFVNIGRRQAHKPQTCRLFDAHLMRGIL